MWRSTTTGSPNCGAPGHDVPVSDGTLSVSSADWIQHHADGHRDLKWHLHAGLDLIARDALEPIGVHFLDVRLLSSMRPDARTKFRHGVCSVQVCSL